METWPFLKDPKDPAVTIQSGLSVSVFPLLRHMSEFLHLIPDHRSSLQIYTLMHSLTNILTHTALMDTQIHTLMIKLYSILCYIYGPFKYFKNAFSYMEYTVKL